jgi:FKBP-type peptidyl-prolyl cis-trans isomerase FkpA
MRGSYRTNRRILFLTGGLLILFSQACKPPVQELKESEPNPVSEQLVKANQYMQQRHQDHISAFVERVGWNAEVTPTGLWIIRENQGTGERVEENSRVTYSFESTLLDGTPCYKASAEKPKMITIGKGGVESGVEQGLTGLRDGAEAIFLIPPHLGHGNFGDREKIPGNSVLIYRLKILKVE